MADRRLRGRVFQALTGQAGADVSGAANGDLLGQLRAIGGSSARTRSGIDLTRAATRLGVSRRTVERWVTNATTGGGRRPSPTSARTIASRARSAATSRRGRRDAVQATRRQAAQRGARLAIRGRQGPTRAGKGYIRDRTTIQDLTPDQAAALFDAYERGGEQGFLDWATNYWDANYLEDWGFETVDGVDVTLG